MLDWYYMNGVDKYIDNEHYVVWKFKASKSAPKKQARPLVYCYTIMTRAYGTYFNSDNFIDYFTREGFDVYLVDWGRNTLFSLQGWTLNDIVDVLEHRIIKPLLEEYRVDKLNLFCICLGGTIVSYMLKQKPELNDSIHRMSFYGVPLFGNRDLGMEKSFKKLFHAMVPWQNLWPVNSLGFSLYFLDLLILQSGSLSMLLWSWEEFYKGRKGLSFMNTIYWTLDDRWVPVPLLMNMMEEAFMNHAKEDDGQSDQDPVKTDIHFLNIVGRNDMLVKPSASIVEYHSTLPDRFKTFEQMIVDTGHFMFAQPGFNQEKKQISNWFAGHPLHERFTKSKPQLDNVVATSVESLFEPEFIEMLGQIQEKEKKQLMARINEMVSSKGNTPSTKIVHEIKTMKHSKKRTDSPSTPHKTKGLDRDRR